MAGMNPPQLPEEPPPVLANDELRWLLLTCEGRDFTALACRRQWVGLAAVCSEQSCPAAACTISAAGLPATDEWNVERLHGSRLEE
jgi:hypothetical protein